MSCPGHPALQNTGLLPSFLPNTGWEGETHWQPQLGPREAEPISEEAGKPEAS